MIRRAGLVVLSSLLPLGCTETPTSPAPGPVTPVESAVGSPQRVPATVEESLSDPLVADLMTGLGDRAAAARLDLSLRAVRVNAESGRAAEVRIALTEAIGMLETIDPRDPDDGLALAVLELVLRDLAEGVPTDPPPSDGGPR